MTIISLVLISACTKTNPDESAPTAEPIVFGSSIQATPSKTSTPNTQFDTTTSDNNISIFIDNDATKFATGDRIRLIGYRAPAPGPTTSFNSPFLKETEFTYNATKEIFTSSATTAFWQLGKAHNFYGYYPSSLTPTISSTTITAPLTVTPGTAVAQDVMLAQTQTPVYNGATALSTDLTFSHKLSKVKFIIKREPDATPSKLTAIEFQTSSKAASIDLTTGNVTLTPGKVTLSKTFAPLTITAAEQAVPAEWIVLPNDLLSNIILTIDNKKMKLINAGSTTNTVQGKINVITITVKANKITFTTDITPWSDAPLKDIDENGQYSLSVDKALLTLTGVAISGSITYSTTFPQGATVTTEPQPWLTQTSPGNESPITLSATLNNTGATRESSVTITAGRLSKKVIVRQTIPPKIGDYYYSDHSFSTIYAPPQGTTLMGVIYRVETDGTGMIVETTESTPGIMWGEAGLLSYANSETNGKKNTNTVIQIINWQAKYVAFDYCQRKNTDFINIDWYLPSTSETKALYAGTCGLRWVPSGATTGQINNWANNIDMPGNANYATNRAAFNNRLTAASAAPLAPERYWSSTEATSTAAWSVSFASGLGGSRSKADNLAVRSRCIRAF